MISKLLHEGLIIAGVLCVCVCMCVYKTVVKIKFSLYVLCKWYRVLVIRPNKCDPRGTSKSSLFPKTILPHFRNFPPGRKKFFQFIFKQ